MPHIGNNFIVLFSLNYRKFNSLDYYCLICMIFKELNEILRCFEHCCKIHYTNFFVEIYILEGSMKYLFGTLFECNKWLDWENYIFFLHWPSSFYIVPCFQASFLSLSLNHQIYLFATVWHTHAFIEQQEIIAWIKKVC